jgi:mono/diheme cytochrome c family protein
VQRTVAKYDDEERAALADAIVALSAEAALPAQQALDQREAARLAAGRKAITDTLSCLDCHTFHNEDEDASAPDLTGYGSETWLMGMISDPTHTRFYGSRNDRMPEFGKDERLSEREIRLLARWLRGDWHRGGVPAGSGE